MEFGFDTLNDHIPFPVHLHISSYPLISVSEGNANFNWLNSCQLAILVAATPR